MDFNPRFPLLTPRFLRHQLANELASQCETRYLMAQNKWLWGNSFVGLVDEGREIKPRLQPLPEEGGEQLALQMEDVVLGLIGGGDVVDNEA